jgi:hypothetical protein
MCCTVVFNIFLPDNVTNVGQITMLNSGLQEYYSDADNFGAPSLDPRLKAVLLGAVFNIVPYVLSTDSILNPLKISVQS